jgi:hypothetical protein
MMPDKPLKRPRDPAQLANNFVRVHKSLRVTPAMAANVTKRLWEMGDIVDVLEAWEAAVHPQAR